MLEELEEVGEIDLMSGKIEFGFFPTTQNTFVPDDVQIEQVLYSQEQGKSYTQFETVGC